MADLFKGKYRIQSARCPKWDYSSEGAYFITICTDRREHFFGIIENQTVILSEAGQIAKKLWAELPLHFSFIKLDVFVIMPNHMHGILIIDHESHITQQLISGKKNLKDHPQHSKNIMSTGFMSQISPKHGSLSSVVRSYKSACSNQINKMNPDLNFKWQTRFHDHIIRNIKSHQNIRQYILNNPAKWNDDIFRR